jgi:hypothetical protein
MRHSKLPDVSKTTQWLQKQALGSPAGLNNLDQYNTGQWASVDSAVYLWIYSLALDRSTRRQQAH